MSEQQHTDDESPVARGVKRPANVTDESSDPQFESGAEGPKRATARATAAAGGATGKSADTTDNLAAWTCCICLDLLREPAESPCCGNCTCKECAVTWFREHRTCPVCRISVSDGDEFLAGCLPAGWRVSLFIQRQLLELRVPCRFSPRCQAVMTVGERTGHEAECEFRLFECPHCRRSMPHDQEQQHRGECPEAAVRCKACRVYVRRRLLDAHSFGPSEPSAGSLPPANSSSACVKELLSQRRRQDSERLQLMLALSMFARDSGEMVCLPPPAAKLKPFRMTFSARSCFRSVVEKALQEWPVLAAHFDIMCWAKYCNPPELAEGELSGRLLLDYDKPFEALGLVAGSIFSFV